MKPVSRSEILDLGGYEQIRERFRMRLIEAKKHRRLAVGPHMTFIWENHDTVLYQIQEMLRTERITSESAVAHELETYNELVPRAGELRATLMIEYDDAAERKVALEKLSSVRTEVSMLIGDRRVKATFHDQPGEEADRLPAVNYVHFEVGDAARDFEDPNVRVELHVDNAFYTQRAELPAGMRKALALDLREPS